MTTTTLPVLASSPTHSARRAIVAAGLACGVLDIAAACTRATMNNSTPIRVLKSVASALLGGSAFNGGWPTAALGLLMHFCVAFTWAAIFYALSRRFPALLRGRAIPAGLAYGAFVYVAMSWGVVPLCAVVRKLYLPDSAVRFGALNFPGLLIHLAFVGLPIALAVRHFSPRPAAKSTA